MPAMVLAAFCSMAAQRACDPMLAAIATDFGADLAAAARTIGLFALGYGAMQLLHGPLGDRFGKPRMIGIACGASAVANLAAALAPTLPALLAARLIGGGAAAAVIPLGMAWVGDTVAYRDRQAALARFLMGTVFGLIAGQMLGAAIARWFGWRAMFGLLAALFALAAAGLGRHAGAAAGQPAGGVGGRAVLARPGVSLVLLTAFVEGAAVFGVLAWLPVYLSQVHGVDPVKAGVASGLYGIGAFAFLAAAGPLLRRLGEPGLGACGAALFAGAVGVLLAPLPFGAAAPACLVAGFGFYMLHNTLQTVATQMAPQRRGTAMALFASALFLGQSAGIALGAEAQSAGRLESHYALSATVVALLGLCFAIARRHRGPRAPAPDVRHP